MSEVNKVIQALRNDGKDRAKFNVNPAKNPFSKAAYDLCGYNGPLIRGYADVFFTLVKESPSIVALVDDEERGIKYRTNRPDRHSVIRDEKSVAEAHEVNRRRWLLETPLRKESKEMNGTIHGTVDQYCKAKVRAVFKEMVRKVIKDQRAKSFQRKLETVKTNVRIMRSKERFAAASPATRALLAPADDARPPVAALPVARVNPAMVNDAPPRVITITRVEPRSTCQVAAFPQVDGFTRGDIPPSEEKKNDSSCGHGVEVNEDSAKAESEARPASEVEEAEDTKKAAEDNYVPQADDGELSSSSDDFESSSEDSESSSESGSEASNSNEASNNDAGGNKKEGGLGKEISIEAGNMESVDEKTKGQDTGDDASDVIATGNGSEDKKRKAIEDDADYSHSSKKRKVVSPDGSIKGVDDAFSKVIERLFSETPEGKKVYGDVEKMDELFENTIKRVWKESKKVLLYN